MVKGIDPHFPFFWVCVFSVLQEGAERVLGVQSDYSFVPERVAFCSPLV
jgi:hypothetical protein